MNYKVIGVATFISEEEYSEKYGYCKPIEVHPVLVYEIVGAMTFNIEYYKNDEGSMNTLYDYMVDEKFTIEEARIAFPELFL